MILKSVGLLSRYTKNILISIDQLWSVFLGGDPDETISSRVGKWSASESIAGKFFEFILDALFGKGHCAQSIEQDEGKNKIL